jgi:hypothetical protein
MSLHVTDEIGRKPLPAPARHLEALVLSNHYHLVLHVDRDRAEG